MTTRQAMQVAMQHHEAGRWAKAESISQQVLAAEPANADALHLLGVIAHQTDNNEVAVALIEKALALDAANPFFLNSLGEAYRALMRPLDAEGVYRRALALKPDYAAAYNNLGNALKTLRRFDEAEQSYRKAIQLDPALDRARLNYSLLQLLQGNYDSGFALYENRFQGAEPRQIETARNLLGEFEDKRRWGGQDLEGKTLLVWTEQGLGDSLMMMRYLPLLNSRGVGHLIVYCDALLVRIMQTSAGVDEVVSMEHPIAKDAFHYHCSLMSLPLLFGTRLETVPAGVPYVRVPDSLRQKWARRLGDIAPPRVGLVWAGGKRSHAEALRSIQLKSFSPLLELGGASFVSLQKGGDADQLKDVSSDILDVMNECVDFLETAALVQQLDLVISVDTSVAHLAGALGRPVWLVSRFESVWQWMVDREDTPWYPTMRIFRQSASGNWDDVIARMVSAFKLGFIQPASASQLKTTSLWNYLLSKLQE